MIWNHYTWVIWKRNQEKKTLTYIFKIRNPGKINTEIRNVPRFSREFGQIPRTTVQRMSGTRVQACFYAGNAIDRARAVRSYRVGAHNRMQNTLNWQTSAWVPTPGGAAVDAHFTGSVTVVGERLRKKPAGRRSIISSYIAGTACNDDEG